MSGFGGGHSSGGGGFHGGHSHSSGGFHGGHRSGGYHSSSHSSYRPHHSTHIYVGGERGYRSAGSNRIYQEPNLIGSIIGGIILMILGIVLFINLFSLSVEATITNTSLAYDNGYPYEEYTFKYTVGGSTYYGNGDDELVYFIDEANYKESVKKGESYTLYVRALDHSDYNFESNNGPAVFVLLLLGIIGISIIVTQVKKYQGFLETIGDLNSDGKLDKNDIKLYRKKLLEKELDPLGEEKPKFKKCDYCESLVDLDSKNCPNCGASLKQ